MDSAEKAHPESEDEIEDLSKKPKESIPQKITPRVDLVAVADSDESDQDDRYAEKSTYDSKPTKNEVLSSGSDTEDEIDRVERKKAQAIIGEVKVVDAYDQSTDDEQKPAEKTPEKISNEQSALKPLPEFFAGKKFYLSSNLGSVDIIKLTRFIGVYGGKIIVNAADANYIVSNKAKQLPDNFPGEVVKPLWVFECNDLECLLPTHRYKF